MDIFTKQAIRTGDRLTLRLGYRMIVLFIDNDIEAVMLPTLQRKTLNFHNNLLHDTNILYDVVRVERLTNITTLFDITPSYITLGERT